MKSYYTLNVELTLVGPLLTSGGEMSEPGIDAPMARDRWGRFMLPFSLIKGKVRDAFRDLGKDAEFMKTWLGSESPTGGYDPERGLLRFSDFHTTQPGTPGKVIDRIQLDAATGSVAGRMLQMVEAPFGYGEEVKFQGDIEFAADDESHAATIASEVENALRWVPAYGAYRTVGFGRTKKVEVTLGAISPSSQGAAASGATLPFSLTLDRPLCVVGRKHSRNHFESEEVISGAVLKGTVAKMILELTGSDKRFVSKDVQGGFSNLCRNFEKLRFAEARPRVSVSTGRPIEPPLSIVTSPALKATGQYFDVALDAHSQLIHGAAPAFAPDWKWKDFKLVRTQAFGWPTLPKERRTRTAIEEKTGRASDEQLFSYGLVLPDGKSDTGNYQFVWEGSIGLEGIEEAEQPAVREELETLLGNGIVGIGKTRAVGSVSWQPTPSANPESTKPIAGNTFVITLQTEFLMTNPELLKSNASGVMTSAYADYWTEVSGGSLKLIRHFARQSLHGGFLSQRSFGKDKYEPFLVTDRGSVFVLEAVDAAKAQGLIDKWVIGGLPVPAWVGERYGKTPDGEPQWQRCPFLPHAGYGEIAVNLHCHKTKRYLPTSTPSGESE